MSGGPSVHMGAAALQSVHMGAAALQAASPAGGEQAGPAGHTRQVRQTGPVGCNQLHQQNQIRERTVYFTADAGARMSF